ncbi:MAG TPA: L-threonylcarbamoyladenylate synthase [Anaerolinea sp.]|nr:L-threonylcarbamoyladenylate synthase [Anaerolinea sp.]
MPTQTMQTSHPLAISTALAVLRSGGLVAFPTDTVYGLACDPFSTEAVERLFDAKTRSSNKAVAVLVGSLEQIHQLTPGLGESAMKLARRFWPGALTLVVPRHPDLPENLSPYPTIGVRMPDHPFALELLRRSGPLGTSSANLSGGSNPLTAGDVLAQLDGRIDLLLDGGECPGGVPSTVVDCTTPDLKILRQGEITKEIIDSVLRAE